MGVIEDKFGESEGCQIIKDIKGTLYNSWSMERNSRGLQKLKVLAVDGNKK